MTNVNPMFSKDIIEVVANVPNGSSVQKPVYLPAHVTAAQLTRIYVSAASGTASEVNLAIRPFQYSGSYFAQMNVNLGSKGVELLPDVWIDNLQGSIIWLDVEVTVGGTSDIQLDIRFAEPVPQQQSYPPAYREYVVGDQDWMYSTVADAITAVNDDPPSATDRALVRIMPGSFSMSSAISVPSYTVIQGAGKNCTLLYNTTTNMFTVGGDNVWFENFSVLSSNQNSLFVFNCNNQDNISIQNVDMINDSGADGQGFIQQSGSTWINLRVEHCYLRSERASGYLIELINTTSAARECDAWINDLYSDTSALTANGGSFLIQGLQTVKISGSTITGSTSYQRGIRLELNGVTDTPSVLVYNCRFEAPSGYSIQSTAGTNVNLFNSDAANLNLLGSLSNRGSQV